MSTKQKVDTRSSTEVELVIVNKIISKVLWTKLFIEVQGHEVTTNVTYHDNTSSMKLEENGKASSGKRMHQHFNIRYFCLTDLIERRQKVQMMEYCSMNAMIADYMTNPLVCTKFMHFRRLRDNQFKPTVLQVYEHTSVSRLNVRSHDRALLEQ